VKEILVFHVRLAEVAPSVWRRFELRAEGTFWHLHCALQDVMPWKDSHLHEFEFPTGDAPTRIGIAIPEVEDVTDYEILASWDTLLKDWFVTTPSGCIYRYDFGDNWEHHVTLEARRAAIPGERFPRCLAGERKCPPEDVGGPSGYAEFLEAMSNRRSERHREYMHWFGAPFDSERFRPEEVRFSRPATRLRQAELP
jgi:Plasmid pRiA4b ORF-3-like protein